jgi:putative addiction module killer protein
VVAISVKILVVEEGYAPFDEWYNSITDKKARVTVASRIRRVREGNFGDHKNVGSGVSEVRIHLGPGYRIYYGRCGSSLVILLGGGIKRKQDQDIEEAVSLWERYKNEIERYSRDI